MERQDFNEIEKVDCYIRLPSDDECGALGTGYDSLLIIRNSDKSVMAILSRDDLFDANGNRFQF